MKYFLIIPIFFSYLSNAQTIDTLKFRFSNGDIKYLLVRDVSEIAENTDSIVVIHNKKRAFIHPNQMPVSILQQAAIDLKSDASHTHSFSSLTSKPTTLSGYGITDGVANSITVNGHALSSNVTITPTDLSLVIGTNTQAYDADLTTWAGLTPSTVGQNLATLTNPSAIRYLKINADNTVTARTAAEMLSDIGAQASGNYVTSGGALGTPSSGVATNLTGTAASLTAGNVTTNANLTGDVTSSGNATTVVKINGTTMSSLATGILKNTTGTGVPSIAAAGTDYQIPITAGDVTTSGATATIGATKVTNAMLAGSIAYSKLSLAGAILNNDLAGSIDLTTKVTGILPAANGGTGVNNSTRTLTINTNSVTIAVPTASTTQTFANATSTVVGKVAQVDIASTASATSTTTIFTPSANGIYRLSIYLKITTTGTSPVAGPVTITYTEPDGSVAQSHVMLLQSTTGTVVTTTVNNSTTTGTVNGSMIFNAKTGVAIQYAIAVSGTFGAGRYMAHITLEAL